jgi:hypothetical protein
VVPENEDRPLASRPILSALAFAGGEPVAEARHAARGFLTEVQAVHGIPVSDRAMGMVQLVVSELVTNAHKYAPGPCLLDLEISDGAVEISVWDTDPTLPVAQAADPGRVGQHGRAFFLSAFAALGDPASSANYDKKIAQGKHHTQALLCLARRRADVLFAMLRDETFYEPQPAGAR